MTKCKSTAYAIVSIQSHSRSSSFLLSVDLALDATLEGMKIRNAANTDPFPRACDGSPPGAGVSCEEITSTKSKTRFSSTKHRHDMAPKSFHKSIVKALCGVAQKNIISANFCREWQYRAFLEVHQKVSFEHDFVLIEYNR